MDIIAHRGASGYLPEHTLAAKAMAHAQLADFLEQDVVLTSDNVPIVLHDIHLDTVTDVATAFPTRVRSDGRFYALDFTWQEIQSLRVWERFDPQTGIAVFPQRFPTRTGRFRIPSLSDELEFIQGLNRSTGRQAGIYPEIKQPRFHLEQGYDITAVVLSTLAGFGYSNPEDRCWLQCFDADELRRVRESLGCRLKIVQLLEQEDWLPSANTDPARAAMELREIRTYADGIGPPVRWALYLDRPQNSTDFPLVREAHAAGLVVHPWTYRADAIPAGVSSFAELHHLSVRAEIDGIFTDFPDKSRACLAAVRGTD